MKSFGAGKAFLVPLKGANQPDSIPKRFYAYGVVARLALLAAVLELEQTSPEIPAAPLA